MSSKWFILLTLVILTSNLFVECFHVLFTIKKEIKEFEDFLNSTVVDSVDYNINKSFKRRAEKNMINNALECIVKIGAKIGK